MTHTTIVFYVVSIAIVSYMRMRGIFSWEYFGRGSLPPPIRHILLVFRGWIRQFESRGLFVKAVIALQKIVSGLW